MCIVLRQLRVPKPILWQPTLLRLVVGLQFGEGRRLGCREWERRHGYAAPMIGEGLLEGTSGLMGLMARKSRFINGE